MGFYVDLATYQGSASWLAGISGWRAQAVVATGPAKDLSPNDAQAIGAVHRVIVPISCRLHYDCFRMNYEIDGGMGVRLADPIHELVVTVGDGSYLMPNREIATSVMLGLALTHVIPVASSSMTWRGWYVSRHAGRYDRSRSHVPRRCASLRASAPRSASAGRAFPAPSPAGTASMLSRNHRHRS